MPIAHGIKFNPNPGVMANVEPAIAGSENLRFKGFECKATQGSGQAKCRIIHGPTAAAGVPVIDVDLAPKEKDVRFYPQGLPAPDGVTIEHLAGIFDILILFTDS